MRMGEARVATAGEGHGLLDRAQDAPPIGHPGRARRSRPGRPGARWPGAAPRCARAPRARGAARAATRAASRACTTRKTAAPRPKARRATASRVCHHAGRMLEREGGGLLGDPAVRGDGQHLEAIGPGDEAPVGRLSLPRFALRPGVAQSHEAVAVAQRVLVREGGRHEAEGEGGRGPRKLRRFARLEHLSPGQDAIDPDLRIHHPARARRPQVARSAQGPDVDVAPGVKEEGVLVALVAAQPVPGGEDLDRPAFVHARGPAIGAEPEGALPILTHPVEERVGKAAPSVEQAHPAVRIAPIGAPVGGHPEDAS